MLRIFFMRHAETDWNRERRIMGSNPIEINEAGKQQADQSSQGLHPFCFSTIYTSPILRALQTAKVLHQKQNAPLVEDQRLEEIGYGDWVGMTFEEVRKLPGYVPYFRRLQTPVAPKGETLFQVRDRAMAFIHQMKTRHQEEDILVVSHADWIKCVLMELLEIPFANIWKMRIDHCSISLMESEKRGDRIICINQRSDLERLLQPRQAF